MLTRGKVARYAAHGSMFALLVGASSAFARTSVATGGMQQPSDVQTGETSARTGTSATTPSDSQQLAGLQDIIVTAQKRSERINEVPL